MQAIRPGTMRQAGLAANYLFLGVGAVVTLFPFLWMFLATFKTEAEILAWPSQFWPARFTLESYKYIWKSLEHFPRNALNSLVVTVGVVVLSGFFDSLAAFAFAKLKFPGRSGFFTAVLATLLIPFYTLIIPLHQVMKSLGWVNSYMALIVPGASSAFGIFLLWQYMKGLPDEFLEAARMEGASEFIVFWRVYLPLSAPAVATLALFRFINTWNDFLWPLVATNTTEMRTLTVALALMQSNNVMHWSWLMTGAFISVVPVILFYLFAQRHLIDGLTAGGIKG
ncbi:MAG TPA: carbohydrate ABC transporter permease [Symbiobacteriaceae bacterium]|nr:carbohydrate ABC transporter permease [Symbiobacteriaceae bacterium]